MKKISKLITVLMKLTELLDPLEIAVCVIDSVSVIKSSGYQSWRPWL